MITQQNVKTITEMREKAQHLISQVQKSVGPLYILYRSKPQAVLLSLDEYNKLRDLAEGYLDSLSTQEYEREDKKQIEWITHKKLLQELQLKEE